MIFPLFKRFCASLRAIFLSAALLCLGLTAAQAQAASEQPKFEIKAEKPKAAKQSQPRSSDVRKSGELEGWTPPPKGRSNAADAEGGGKSRTPGDGGLPLPSGRSQPAGPESGVGFDKSGNFSTGLKF